MGRNYYSTLEVARAANDYDLKNAYRRLALKFHPQRTGAQNEAQFREIAEAYTVLSDPVKRAKFDQYGEEGLKNGTLDQTEYKGYQYVGDPMQLFYDFFGEASPLAVLIDENYSKFQLQPRTLTNEQKSSSSLDLELRVKLEDLYSCSTICKKIDRQRFDQNNSSYVDTKVLTIKMEKGWKPGMKLKFKGEGNQLYPKSGPAGDIYFTLVEDEHPTFERILDTYDVLYIHKCSLVEAMTGHIISLNLLDGNCLNLHVSEAVNPGYEKRVLEHGFPKPDGTFGDLIIRWDIEFPTLSSEQKAALKKVLA